MSGAQSIVSGSSKASTTLQILFFCDRRTVDPWVLTRDPLDSTPVLLVERPRDDFSLFCKAITILISLTFCLLTALGSYVSKPHCQDLWLLSDDLTALYKIINDSSYTCYSLLASACATHFSTSFLNPRLCVGQCSCNIRASVVVGENPLVVTVHSCAQVYRPPVHRCLFLECIWSLPNQSLWKTPVIDGDGTWIY